MVLNTGNISTTRFVLFTCSLHISLMSVKHGSTDYVLFKEEGLGSNSSF